MINIVGLGLGTKEGLTLEASQIIASAQEIYIRSSNDPIVNLIPAHVKINSFDEEYNIFKGRQVYINIAKKIIELYVQNGEIVYCVPGNAFAGETSVNMVVDQAVSNGLPIRIVPGVSFIDAVIQAARIDPLGGFELLSAEELIFQKYPGINPQNEVIVAMIVWPVKLEDIYQILRHIYPAEYVIYIIERAGTVEENITSLKLEELVLVRQPHPQSCLYIPKWKAGQNICRLIEKVYFWQAQSDSSQFRAIEKKEVLNELVKILAKFDNLTAFLQNLASELNLIQQTTEYKNSEGERVRWDLIERILGQTLLDKDVRQNFVLQPDTYLAVYDLNNLEYIIIKRLIDLF